MSEQSRIIQLWKENNVAEAVFTFSCGGDSMNDTEWAFKNANGDELKLDANGVDPKRIIYAELEDYFNDEVYNKCTFYVNSDGHYNGEAGTVTVELVEDEEPYFTYSKWAESEYSESHTETVEVPLTASEAEFIRKYVLNINGGNDENFVLNYKGDCLLTDDDEAILEGFKDSIDNFIHEYEPLGEIEGELNDWYNYTTDISDEGEGNEPLFKDDTTLLIEKTFTVTVFRSDND